MSTIKLNNNILAPLIVALLTLIVFSRISLLDRTESRVAVVANHLVEQNDLFHLYLPKDGEWVPYWAKPPLQYWLIASSIELFGKHEFSVRLPSLLAGILTLLLMTCFKPTASNAPLIAGSALLFFGVYGTGLIDGPLTLTLTATLLGLYRWIIKENKWFSTVLLIGCGAGLACAFKGLLGFAIPGITVCTYALLTRDRTLIMRLPWLKGSLAIFFLVAIYYGSIEYFNPGFCNYFFINENILRFIANDYGDRTGSGHAQFYGTSIIFFILSFLPWTPFLLHSLYLKKAKTKEDLFFLSATLAPIVLFLFAKQHLATYQLPALIPAALLLSDRISRRVTICTASTMFILYLATGIFVSPYINGLFSSAPAIKAADALNVKKLHFQYEIPLSAYWYTSDGDSLDMATPFETETDFHPYFIVREKHLQQFDTDFGHLSTANTQIGKWTLYESRTE